MRESRALLLSAHLSHRNSVCHHMGGSVKNGAR